MKRPFVVITLLLLFLMVPSADDPTARPVKLLGDYCELYGQVFIEDTPGFADYKVYLEDSESFADMAVYRETSSSFATDPGYWYFTDVSGFADFRIEIVSSPAFADFSIAYTDFRTSAGCR